jgi:protein SCO1/2
MNWLRGVATMIVLGVLLVIASPVTRAQTIPSDVGKSSANLPPALVNVGFEPPLNGQIPLDVNFRDETGREVRLADYFSGQKPVVLALVYYACPMLCNQVEQGVVGSLKMLSFNAGRDYEVVFISFDPRETSEMAAQKKQSAMSHYGRPETSAGWHFLTGSKDSIDAVAKAANFRFSFDSKSGIFAHASGIMLLTASGRISRYFYGVEYPSRDMRLGLVDASAGKIGTPIDHLLLYCFQYDPSAARYSATILRIVRLGGIATILLMIAGFVIFRRRDERPALGGRAEQGAH